MAVPLMPVPAEVPVPAPDPLLPALAATLAEAALQRQDVATGLERDVITPCETAIAKLREAAETLLQEPGDAAEILYADLLELLPHAHGQDSPLLGPAGSIVDALFNAPGPLAGAIAVAGDLVHDNFDFPPPNGGPLQAALRDLGYLIDVPHATAGDRFNEYASEYTMHLGVLLLPGGEDAWELWQDNHVMARVRAKKALARLTDAASWSLEADVAIRLCQGEWEERLPPAEHMAAAELMLHNTINEAEAALVLLREVRDNLVELEQIVMNATGQAPPSMAVPLMPVPAEVPVPAPDPLLVALAATLAEAARHRQDVATGLEPFVITPCETAIAKLREAAETLLQEPGDAAEILYADLLELLPHVHGQDSPLLGPAASIVDALFNAPGPLAGAIAVAADLVHDTFDFMLPQGGPLQGARRELFSLIRLCHAKAGHRFNEYAREYTMHFGVLPGGEDAWELWEDSHVMTRVRAKKALARLVDAVSWSLEADDAVRLCQGEWEERLPLAEHMAAAELMLHNTINEADAALVLLREVRDNLVELEQIVMNATGQAPPP